jgi:hypothetical protein
MTTRDETVVGIDYHHDQSNSSQATFSVVNKRNLLHFPVVLKAAEAVRKSKPSKIRNTDKYRFYEFRITGSVLMKFIGLTVFMTLWATLICVLYFYAKV